MQKVLHRDYLSPIREVLPMTNKQIIAAESGRT